MLSVRRVLATGPGQRPRGDMGESGLGGVRGFDIREKQKDHMVSIVWLLNIFIFSIDN